MAEQTTILVAYTIFIWMVVLHTFEEIASGIFDLQLGHIKVKKNRYLLAASGISTLNMVTLILLILGLPAGGYLGLFTTAGLGVLQGVVHTVGYFREGRKARGLGAGFYSAIPLTVVGAGTFYILVKSVFLRVIRGVFELRPYFLMKSVRSQPDLQHPIPTLVII